MNWVLIIVVAVIALIVIWAIVSYNGFVSLRNRVEEAFSTMDVYLKKRYDLIPNLVETVKGYAKHESETLATVIDARNHAVNAKSVDEKIAAEKELAQSMFNLNAVAEQYPDLKANQNFFELQEELRNTENKISYARQFYNDSVTMYNTKLQVVPTNIVAGMFHFTEEPLFKVDSDEVKQNVKVDFSK